MANATLETSPAVDTVETPQMPEQKEQTEKQKEAAKKIRELVTTCEADIRDVIAKAQEEQETAVVEASEAMAA